MMSKWEDHVPITVSCRLQLTIIRKVSLESREICFKTPGIVKDVAAKKKKFHFAVNHGQKR